MDKVELGDRATDVVNSCCSDDDFPDGLSRSGEFASDDVKRAKTADTRTALQRMSTGRTRVAADGLGSFLFWLRNRCKVLELRALHLTDACENGIEVGDLSAELLRQGSGGGASKDDRDGDDAMHVSWLWQDEHQNWTPYNEKISAKLGEPPISAVLGK